MSQTLYRKYRSQTFAELIGQDAVVRVLRNSIVRGHLSHAYLFCGPRGTGKTSVARIFAKALNCLDPHDGDACGVCENCTAIASGNAVDVIEIDAASNRSVEDVEELRKRVGYAPISFRYKVYIIDEVHMISTHGFNALLKTLEEPPPHVVFCLCTTEANKLPVTILSRCIRFDFTRIPLPRLGAHLQAISDQEGLSLDEDAALELASLAEGSARDAISLLDQLTVYCEGRIALKDIRELFQLGDPALMGRIVAALEDGEPQGLLGSWNELALAGMDASRFLLELAGALKQRHLAEPGGRWRSALEAVWKGLNLLKYDNFPALLIELTLLEAQAALSAPAQAPAAQAGPEPVRRPQSTQTSPAAGQRDNPAHQQRPVQQRPEQQRPEQQSRTEPSAIDAARQDGGYVSPARQALQQKTGRTAGAEQGPQQGQGAQAPTGGAAAPKPSHATSGPALPNRLEEWERFLVALEAQSTTTYSLLVSEASGLVEGAMLHIYFAAGARQVSVWMRNDPRHAEAIRQTAEKVYGRPLGILVSVMGEDGPPVILLPGEQTEGQRRPAPELAADDVDYGEAPLEPDPRDEAEFGGHVAAAPRGLDPSEMLRDVDNMARQLDAASPAQDDASGRRLTAEEALSLFEAEEILEDEHALD